MPESSKNLPVELKHLVGDLVALLGDVIREDGGDQVYRHVESIRKSMILYRTASFEKRNTILEKTFKRLKVVRYEERHAIAQAFTLMLELTNTCESAYRTYRLQEKDNKAPKRFNNNSLVYVLTAHPTEARTPDNIELFRRIQAIAIRLLNKSGEPEYLKEIIKHNLKIAWRLPVTRHRKPEVLDEAKHLFSIIFEKEIFDTIIRANRDIADIRIRTWVGGDKDGHPGVDEKVMLKCLQASRAHLLQRTNQVLSHLKDDIDFLDNKTLKDGVKDLQNYLQKLKKIQKGDFERIQNFKLKLKNFTKLYLKFINMTSPRLLKIQSILELFPSLVVPIELREDSEVIKKSLDSRRPLAIVRMLKKLKDIAGKDQVKNYAQGMIISMCNDYQDIKNTHKMVKSIFKTIPLPIIPLFETQEALDKSEEMIKKLLANKTYITKVRKKWNNRLEVMLGYSDSSKGMGVLPSRLGIAETMKKLDQLLLKQKLEPVFFHGSGGSVDRGGGSVTEQTAWWPMSALNFYKATIQGEMVERNFASPEIFLSGINKVLANFQTRKESKTPGTPRVLKEFALFIRDHYQTLIEDPNFYSMVAKATPYSYLSVLKLGSRPTKRSKSKVLDFSSIRAIPWILCWTQTRLLFPTWWGVGSAWKTIKKEKKSLELKKAYQENFLFRSYIRVLAFTLSKVEMNVFYFYLKHSSLSHDEIWRLYENFNEEYQASIQFIKEITQKNELLWYKKWLADSIKLRSSMIHPLNLLQILAKEEKDSELLRKTVAGISSGMMTTG